MVGVLYIICLMEPSGHHPEEEAKQSYEFFDDEEARLDLFYYCKSLADYMQSREVADIVIMDRSARPVYTGILEYWRKHYPDTPRPGFFFLNPMGFRSTDNTSEDDAAYASVSALLKGDALSLPEEMRSDDEIDEEFEQAYPKLMGDKDKPVVIFDTCVHTGESLSPAVEAMERAGFDDLRVITANPPDDRYDASIRPDFSLNFIESQNVCYPFDRDRLVEKTFEHVYSQRSTDPEALRKGTALRAEIRRIMREYDEQ